MRSGFTLIELLIGIAIIGLMTTMVAPFLASRPIGYERKQFVSKLNGLIQYAQQQAIISRKMHRIFFNIKERIAYVEQDIAPSPKAKKQVFGPVKKGMIASRMSWPASLEIKQFIVGGFDEMQRSSGKTKEVWMYVGIDGMAQQATINFIDKDAGEIGKPVQMGLVINPFTAQGKVYDAFQK
jgi:prepilin-type N-terminal cleavage/methylation domain